MRLAAIGAFLVAVLVPALASAQDYGRTWVDRVTHQLIEEESPLSTHPLNYQATVGELYAYDDNIFLTDTNRTKDNILLSFAEARLDVAGPKFDAAVDLSLDYSVYLHERVSDGDEERIFGRVRYQGSQIMVQLSEIARREVSPTDVVFVHRVPRFISDTTPLIVVNFNDSFFAEVQSDIEFVQFLRTTFETADNFNTRSSLTLGYKTSLSDLDALVQGGYLTIHYTEPGGPPDAQGYFGRLGLRGDLAPRLRVIALGGITSAKSDDFPNTTVNVEHTTADIEIHVAYTLKENSTLYADYSRRIGWSVPIPFEVVDSSDVIGEISLREDLILRARAQYDRVHGPLTLTRAYYSGSLGGEYQIRRRILLDAGVTYRQGEARSPGGAADFKDFIVTAGVAIKFN